MKTMVLPSSLRQLLQHRLQPLLELAAVLGAGEQRRHVERQHALVLQRLGHFAVDDALRQALDDRGLAHARLADQHRIVLGAPLQDLDACGGSRRRGRSPGRACPGARARSGRACISPAPRAGLRLLVALHVLAAAHRVDRLLERCLASAPCCLQQPPGLALVVGGASRNISRGDELVAALLRFLVGDVEQIA